LILLEFSISPLGAGESVSAEVARAVHIVASSGLPYPTHAMGTLIEGDWDAVMAVVKQCFEAIATDNNRVTCALKLDYRKGHQGRIQRKVQSVDEKVKALQSGGDAG